MNLSVLKKSCIALLLVIAAIIAKAQPRITSVTPLTGKPGDTITIVGTSFAGTVALTDVYFGNARVTSYRSASTTTLRVIVPVGATYGPILVFDKLNTKYGISKQFFSPTFAKPKGSFAAGDMTVSGMFATGTNPYSVAVGDVDGDAKPDAVVVNYTARTVSVLRNTSTVGNVSFADTVSFATGVNPMAVALADIDNDQKLDIIVVNNGSNNVSVYKNTSTATGTVSFATRVNFATGNTGAAPNALAIADINGDGFQDIVATNGGTNTVAYLQNTSTTTAISFATRLTFATGTMPQGVAIADLDGNGALDLAVANNSDNTVSVLQNNTTSSTISFATKVDYTVGTAPQSVTIGDITGDGKLDVIASNYTTGSISTLRNISVSGTVTLNPAVNKLSTYFPETIGITDIDADGKVDVVYANSASSFSVLKNTTTTATSPTYATSVDFTTGSLTKAHSMGDIDGDGKIDAVVITNYNNAIVVVRNTPAYSNNANLLALTTSAGAITPSFNASTTSYTASVPNATTSITVKPTIAQDSATLQLQLNGGTYSTISSGVSTSALTLNLGENIINIKVTAQDGTTIKIYTLTVTRIAPPTVTAISPMSGTVGTTVTITGTFFSSTPANNVVYFGATKATVTAATTTSLTVTVPTGATYAPITVLNTISGLSGEGKDYFNTTFKPNKGSIDTMDMTASANFGVNSYPKNVAIGDIDGDGKSDAVVLDAVASKFSVLRNTSNIGAVNFASKVDFTTLSSPETVTLGDINNDGKLDVVVVDFLTDSVSIYRNTSTSGAISFAPMFKVLCGLSTGTYRKCVIGDIDGDGKPDITLGTYSLGQYVISVLRNTSTSATSLSFAFFTTFVTGNNPIHLAIGDINKDGKLDIVTANANAANATGTAYYQISVLKNTSVSGTISFATKQDFTVDGQPSFVALGDVDGDGVNDIITGNVGTNNISVLINYSNATGVFMGTVRNFTTGINSATLGVADYDGDGRVDIAVNPNGKGLYMLRNITNTTGASNVSFTTPITLAKNITLSSIVAGDIDGDGKADITAINNTTSPDSLVVLKNTPILSSNNNLKALTTTAGSLIPTFDSLTTAYNVSVHNPITSITVTATKAQDSAKIEMQYNGGAYSSIASGVASSSLALNLGENIINLKVTAQNGAIKIYTIVVYRACLAPSSTTNLAVCPSQMPYQWNGLTFTTAGSKSTILTTANGCDSSVTLNLSLKTNSTSTTTLSACDSLVWNGTTYKTSGSYTIHLTNSVGCDSAATLNATIKKSTTSWTDVITCDSTKWNGVWYSKSGFYTVHFTNKAGCDSAASLNLTVNDKPTGSFSSSNGDICAGDSSVISFYVPYTTNRQYLHIYTPIDTTFEIGTASFGADTRTTPLSGNSIVYLPNSSPSNQACSTTFATGLFNGQVVVIDRGNCTFAAKAKAVQDAGAAGIIIVNNVAGGAMAMAGTDATVTIPVISVSQADGQIIKNWISAGQFTNGYSVVHTPTYLWNTGATSNNITAKPTTTTMYNVTVSYENGCSQKFYYALLVRQKSTSWTDVVACDSTIWNGITYKTSGQYIYHTLNSVGCDSAATLNLIINKSTSSWTDIVTCDSAFWNGVWYKQNGQYTVHLQNSKGCDSAALLNLTITPKPNAGTISGTSSFCFIGGSTTLSSNGDAGGVWSSNNSNRVSVTSAGKVTASMGGNYIIYYTVTNACGSATTSFNIKVNVPSSTTIAVDACSSYTWNGTTYTQSGNYTKTGMTNVGGCDSTATLSLTIKQPTTSTTNLSVCDSVVWNGVKYKTSGIYVIHKTNAAGCDSALTLNLTIKKSTTSWTDVIACDSTIWNGTTYKTSGLYVIHKTNAAGCDSALTLNLTVKKATTSWTDVIVCDSTIWNGITYKTSGLYVIHKTNAAGCDSALTLNLTVKKATTSWTDVIACDSTIWNGVTYKTSGLYVIHKTNAAGCDSALTLNLTVKKATTSWTDVIACDSTIWNGVTYKASGLYVIHKTNAAGCDSALTLNLTVNNVVKTYITQNFADCKSVIYNGITYTSNTTVKDTIRTARGCDSVYRVANITIRGIIPTTTTSNLVGCNSVVYNGTTYTLSTVKRDTVRTAQGCDSIYNIATIIIQPINSISGNVIHPTKAGINNIELKVTGSNNYNRNISKVYMDSCNSNGNNVAIHLYKNNDLSKANGVNSVDALLVQRHILNTTKLNNAYKLIAADVDGNKTINSVDVLRIKRLILGTDTTFKNTTTNENRLWAFVDSAYQFPDTTNPFPFKDSISFTNLTSNKTNQTFIGVKLGDVNFDWNSTVAKPSLIDNVQLTIDKAYEKDKRTINCQLSIANYQLLSALQTTLHFDNTRYEFVSINNNMFDIDFNTTQANTTGNISLVWIDKKGETKTFKAGEELFTLILRKRSTVSGQQLIEKIELTDAITLTAAFDETLTKRGIILRQQSSVNGNLSAVDGQQLTIYPNPTKGNVTIATNGVKQIQIVDYLGRTIKQINNIAPQQTLNAKLLGKGVYFVKATMQDESIRTEKLIVE